MKLKSKYKLILMIFENFGEPFISFKSPYLITPALSHDQV